MYKQYLMTGVITDEVTVNGEECWLIPANPIKSVADWKSVTQYEISDATEYFLFSAETEIVGVELWASIDAGQPLWAPVQADFVQIQIEYRGQLVKAWLHISMIEPIPLEYEDDFDCPWSYDRWNLDYPETTMIRGFVMKRNMMWQFFVEEDTAEASIQNYIVKQAKTNGHFFEWLFDDEALSDVPLDKLDHTHLKDWLRFFHSFDL